MGNNKQRVCPVERAGGLDMKIRRWVHHPQKMLSPYIKNGMRVLDVGCGPGFFTLDMAQLVGKSGSVVASDLQQGMLDIVKEKIEGTPLEKRITLHKTGSDKIGVEAGFDFVLLFYMLHEVPSQEALLEEVGRLLQPGGQVLIVEPPFHVSKQKFNAYIELAEKIDLKKQDSPRFVFSKAILLKKLS